MDGRVYEEASWRVAVPRQDVVLISTVKGRSNAVGVMQTGPAST